MISMIKSAIDRANGKRPQFFPAQNKMDFEHKSDRRNKKLTKLDDQDARTGMKTATHSAQTTIIAPKTNAGPGTNA